MLLFTRRWGRKNFCSLAVSLCLWLVMQPGHGRQADNSPPPEASDPLKTLLDSLRGGPIEIRPAPLPEGMISAEEAVKAAQRFGGFDITPKHAWQVVVTDREFMGNLLDKRPCWLLGYE